MTKNITPLCKKNDVGVYVSGLINQPWARDGRHCWRLVREVQRDIFGRDVSEVLVEAPPPGAAGRRERSRLFAEHAERGRWIEVPEPVDGAIVLMRRSAASIGDFIHSGVWLALDGGGCLHTSDPHGVVFDTYRELRLRGWVPSWFVPRERE